MIHSSCCIGTSADACHQIVRVVATFLFHKLPLDFFANDTLKSCYHVGIRMRTHSRTDEIERIFGAFTPCHQGFVHGVFQGFVATFGRHYCGPKHTHTFHINVLSLHIEGSHVDATFHTHQCAGSGCGNSMLSSTCFSNDALFAHTLSKEDLTEGIVDFMSTRVVEIFTLEINLCPIFLTKATSMIEWARATHIIPQELVKFALKVFTINDREIGFL